MRARIATLCVAVVVLAPGAGVAADSTAWAPHFSAAARYAKHRAGSVRFAVIGPLGKFQGFHAKQTAPSASLLKAMLLVEYLRIVRDRPLHTQDRRLLRPMIIRSDNAAATRVNAIVGHRVYRLAHDARMRDFHWDPSVWGLSRTSPRDQARFFGDLEDLVPARHRAYALHLLASVIGPQRWGIGRVPHAGWNLYFKGGWGSGSGRVDHQAALLTNGSEQISLAIFTEFDPSHRYGKQTLRGVARRLLRGLPD
ncbi:MAG: hypothetical protein QOD60_1289 [Solirubrobacterales bacterium]|jgi:hypothetical protein|nr:hypothetical protein [Solirubrobacterales bacterium]